MKVEALAGLATETLILLPFGVGFLIWCEMTGVGVARHQGTAIDLWLLLGGPVSAIPLALFAYGARRIPLSMVGILQYIGPSIQLLLAIHLFHEPFAGPRVLGFACIWAALVIYAIDGLWRNRKSLSLN